jgi:ADP-ribose pyrophosphatase
VKKDSVWTVLSSTKVYESDPFLAVEKQVVQLPDGRIVEDYHRLKMPDCSIICPTTEDKQVIFLRGYRHGVGEETVFLPGGGTDKGESPLESAKRELLEEVGCTSDNWRMLGSYILHGNYGGGLIHLFHAGNICEFQPADSRDLEDTIVVKMGIEEALEAIVANRLHSLSSALCLMLTASELH